MSKKKISLPFEPLGVTAEPSIGFFYIYENLWGGGDPTPPLFSSHQIFPGYRIKSLVTH